MVDAESGQLLRCDAQQRNRTARTTAATPLLFYADTEDVALEGRYHRRACALRCLAHWDSEFALLMCPLDFPKLIGRLSLTRYGTDFPPGHGRVEGWAARSAARPASVIRRDATPKVHSRSEMNRL